MDAKTLAATDIRAYLRLHERKDLLRFLTCGSVDDGKSTLIGRLLYDCKMIYEDQLAAVMADSKVHGTTGGAFDPALLTDGLKAEREQGITIDVAYRYFSTDRRKFIIADCPGHEQYTRNMATGASNCSLAIILVDARKGILTQTRRHSFIVSLLGIRHVVLAVNKMDLVDWSPDIFESIRADYLEFAARLQFTDLHFIPISALHGDNVVEHSTRCPWYDGPSLLRHLETVNIASDRNLIDLRFPVQLTLRPSSDFRGFAGTLASGVLRTGDEILVAASQRRARVTSILKAGHPVHEAAAPNAITITLDTEIDASRGDMFVHPHNLPHFHNRLEAMLVWMDPAPATLGATDLLTHPSHGIAATLATLRYKVDIHTLRKAPHQPGQTLQMNEIGRAHVVLHRPIPHDSYRKNPATGAFILIDRLTNATVAAGMILDRPVARDTSPAAAPPASTHITREASLITSSDRERLLGQRAATIWLTGLSGSGKSTLARTLEASLTQAGRLCFILDGDNLRHGLCRDLGFTPADRSENIRRAAEAARLLNDAGIIVITSFISPYRADRDQARAIIGPERFLEIYLSAPLQTCEQRDPKGLYKKARAGEIPSFTGISDPYEPPSAPFLELPTHQLTPAEAASRLLAAIEPRIAPADTSSDYYTEGEGI